MDRRGYLILTALLAAGCDSVFGLERPPTACPASYGVVGSSSLYRNSGGTLLSWDAAESSCLADDPGATDVHTHLVVLANDRERLALGASFSEDVWIGLTDQASEGVFVWVTDEMVAYPPSSGGPWGNGEPDNGMGLGAQDCVLIGQRSGGNAGRLVDAACSEMHDYVCECDGHAP